MRASLFLPSNAIPLTERAPHPSRAMRAARPFVPRLALLALLGGSLAGCGGRSPTAPAGGGAFTGTFVLIPAGIFEMGSTTGNLNERPVRTVRLTRAFRLQTTEVTQAQWQAVMGSNPSAHAACGATCPVERVSWEDVQQFLARLNAQDPGKGYRLPTEAEWEYAARAGTGGDFGGTGVLSDMGWYADNSGGRTQPVGQKRANAWGLHDMHGNVWEWVQDWYAGDYYGYGITVDPPGLATGETRVLRGGSRSVSAAGARSASRYHAPPGGQGSDYGFRLAQNP